MAQFEIQTFSETLSDGSLVYNVRLNNNVFAAIDENAAYALAEDLFTAIREHTNESVEVWNWNNHNA